jgi:hypothetical protein
LDENVDVVIKSIQNKTPARILVTVYYLVVMTPMMPIKMIQGRTDVLLNVDGGKREGWITRESHHGRILIQYVHMNSLSDLFDRTYLLRAPRKVVSDVDRLTCHGCKYSARFLEESSDFASVSKCAVHKMLRSRGPRAGWRV